MNSERPSLGQRGLPLLYFLLGLFLSLQLSTARSQSSNGGLTSEVESTFPELLLSVPKQISGIPDCTIEYKTVDFEGSGVSGDVITRKFTKQGQMWKEESFHPNGDLRILNSFDGEKYYTFIPGANQLLVAEDPKLLDRFTIESFGLNPLFLWSNVVFLSSNDEQSMHEKFKIPELGSVDELVAELAKYKIDVRNDGPNGGMVSLQSSSVDSTVSYEVKDGGVIIPAFTFVQKDGNGEPYGTVSKTSLKDWRSESIAAVDVKFPASVEVETTFIRDSSRKVGQRRIQYVDDSLKAGNGGLKKLDFQVPLSVVPNPQLLR